VFVPAGMNDARDDDPSAVIPHRAAGYVRRDNSLFNATHVDMSNRLPAGGYICSVREMAAFAAAFVAGRLVTPATRDSMLRPARLRDGSTVNYGIGWGIEEDDAGKPTGRYFHGGSSPGASGMMLVIPAERIAVVFMTNLESAPERFPAARAVAEILRPGWKP
jgi:CubicO group peptidase (beta-lactamase class C family)